MTQQQEENAANFVYQQFGLMAPVRVSEARQVPENCYTRLHFRVKQTNEDVAQDFYVSPDHRFLSMDLFDLDQFSPTAELAARKALRAELANTNVPVLGSRTATVLVSLFGDFQCPYCREEELLLTREIIPLYKNQITVAFHHMPLQAHAWSMSASETLSCIQTQAPEAFWPVAEWVLENQETLSPAALIPTVLSKTTSFSAVNGLELRRCLAEHLSDPLIKHDQMLAKDLSVTSAPTVFIDGHRLIGAVGASVLKQAIDDAMAR